MFRGTQKMISTQICEQFIKNYIAKTEDLNPSFEKPYRLSHIIQNWTNVQYPMDAVIISERNVIDVMRWEGFTFEGEMFNAEYRGPILDGKIPYKEFEWKRVLLR